ncbi:phosphate ABC transporter membrane protein 2 (PhoT family) [Haloactinopolyspora alba]|uniref:Phosphate transport system permease protein PstA n=1 Tax=Haloactinopolyspora alba TaxID=648780 RepID=A0A2P8DK20_9ACTN|nr:phosphate ABC transporter permease PstA [Haloactinopolyspora alba]PSK97567.1 phosphate ABC transporter membrane protein 2 (PhoT family) [Haloactinopolyspora alba]
MTVDTAARTESTPLTHRQLPRRIVPVVLAVSIAAGAGLAALVGFSLPALAILSAVVFTVAITTVSGVVEGRRKAVDRLVTTLVYSAFAVALVPLISVVWSVLDNGLVRFGADFLNTSMRNVTGLHDQEAVEGIGPYIGGAYHALLGTFLITALATAISVPVGLMTSIYLVEYGRGKLAKAIRFFVDVMTGIPSIVAGLFAASLFAVLFGVGTRNGFAGAVALSVLMIPVVVRSSEEMLRIVPNELREAAYALGVPKWRTIVKVVLPTAVSGIASGVTLAIARVVGETAPLIVTAGFTSSINSNPFSDWMMSLPAYVYSSAMRPLSGSEPQPSFDRAWAAALTLVIIVMALNLIARLIARIFAPKTGR